MIAQSDNALVHTLVAVRHVPSLVLQLRLRHRVNSLNGRVLAPMEGYHPCSRPICLCTQCLAVKA